MNPKMTQPQLAIGEAIRMLRREQGATLKELAPRTGVTFGTLALIERGETNPTWGTVCGVADALEISMRDLGALADRFNRRASSKADAEARYQGIGFKIGDVFSADDPIARWATVLAMAANNTTYLNVRLIEGGLPPELNMYYSRLLFAHFYEAAGWLKRTRRTWLQVDEFIKSLDSENQGRYDRITAFANQEHRFHENLRRSRVTLFHYPEMHPKREASGGEELANAMREAADLPSWIEGGEDYASFRATFADEIAMQFLSDNEEEYKELLEELREPTFELVLFTEAVLLAQLKAAPKDKTTIWGKGKLRPILPETAPSADG
jgi:transcriptional regulator with XRE-family HTH domain